MSLFRQIWLAVILTTLLAFGGSFVLGILSARGYLEEQLAIKNADNAEALALSISQHPGKDHVTRELLIAAQFDTGHYASIRLHDPFGKLVVERKSDPAASDVPSWFVELFPIGSVPGTAKISSGWEQLGVVTVASHASFAYRELWRSSLRLLIWFVLAGSLTGVLASQALRRLKRPVAAVVKQAEAIGERRFVTIPEPGIVELDSLAGAMNAMVMRLKSTFDEQASRIEELRRRANHDELTGLANRAYFENRLQATLSGEEAASGGTLMLLRVPQLAELNARFGRKAADELLVGVGHCIDVVARPHHESFAARLNGADFALLLPGVPDGGAPAGQLLSAICDIGRDFKDVDALAQIGVCHFTRGMTAGAVLARADRALASAESVGTNNWQAASDEVSAFQPSSASDWIGQIRSAISDRRLKLASYPVCAISGEPLHDELMLRMQIDDKSDWLSAGQILPMATRVRLTGELDLAAFDLAIATAREIGAGAAFAINLSADSVENEAFRASLLPRLQSIPEGSRFWIEIPENGLLRHFAAVRALRDSMSGTVCRLGVEHVGRRFGEIARMQELGLDYIKVDASFIRGIGNSEHNRSFLEGLVSVGHGMGVKVIAEGVESEGELNTLQSIGFDGATGPLLTRRVSS